MNEIYEGDDRRKREGWHFDKRVHLGHIITTAVVLITALIYITDQDKRIQRLEDWAQNHQTRDLERINRQHEQFKEVLIELKAIRAELSDFKVDVAGRIK